MATARKPSTKPAVLETEAEEEVETATAAPTEKQIINEAITRVVEATGVDIQKSRYKAMRAIAFQAFVNAIADGSFEDLVDEAIANVDSLPSGWEIERAEKDEPVAKPVAKSKPAATKPAATRKTATTKAAASAAKPAARKRPAR